MASAGAGLWSARGPLRPNGLGGCFSPLPHNLGFCGHFPQITRNPIPLQHRQTPFVRLPVPPQRGHSSLRKSHVRLTQTGQLSVMTLWPHIGSIKVRILDDPIQHVAFRKSLKLAQKRCFSGWMENCRDYRFYPRRELSRGFRNLWNSHRIVRRTVVKLEKFRPTDSDDD
jgi:hypothetical protein